MQNITFKQDVKNAMFEELSISNEVVNASNDIIKKIIKDSKKQPRAQKKTGLFEYSFKKNIIDVNYALMYFANIDELQADDEVKHENAFSRKDDVNRYTLKATIVYIADQNKYIDYNGELQHELHHIFQMISKGEDLITLEKDSSIYNCACSLMNSNDIIEKMVGFTFYYSFKFEEDAYANNIYKDILTYYPSKSIEEIIENNPVYGNLKIIKNAIDDIFYAIRINKVVKKHFKKTYTWFYDLVNSVYSKYIKKLGRVLVKVKKELNEKFVIYDACFFESPMHTSLKDLIDKNI